jgi:phosphatidylinositol-3-phosphatase
MTWRDYNDGMGADPIREPSVCGHPAVSSLDNTLFATATDQYSARHNPFMYFHSIIDDTTLCDTHVVTLDYLQRDLATASNTPNYVFITPDLCNDGHDPTCADGGPGGLAEADAFLREWVPQITGSPAFRTENGLLIITFDESDTSDTSSCCGEIPGPGNPLPGLFGPGGGDIGAVLLSPCIAPGTVSEEPYNHYTMLRSVEDIFGVSHLGDAALPNELSFGPDVFTRACAPPTVTLSQPALASSASRSGPRLIVRWRARGARVAVYTVQVRSDGGRWRTLTARARRSRLVFTGRASRRYQFRVRATDVFGASGPWATTTTWSPRR